MVLDASWTPPPAGEGTRKETQSVSSLIACGVFAIHPSKLSSLSGSATHQDQSVQRQTIAIAIVASPTLLESVYSSLRKGNLSALLPPSANLTSALALASNTFEHFFVGPSDSSEADSTWSDAINRSIAGVADFFDSRSALENSSLLLALCTFLVLAMSWTSRLGNLGRFSPFTRSPTQGSIQVSDADFSYITADDLRKHQAGATQQNDQQPAASPIEHGPPRDTDVLVLRNKRKEYAVHFPAYSIAKGELTVGQVRDHAAKKLGSADPRRVKLLYKGQNLKDDQKACKAVGLRDGAELMCTVAEAMPSASASEDDDDDEFADVDGADPSADGEPRRRRNRGKKSKRRNKRDQQTSGTSTPSEPNLNVPASSVNRSSSPKPPPTPATPMDKLNALYSTLRGFEADCQTLRANPPAEQAKREFEHKRLSETILTQVLLKLDAVETEGDADARARRKELVRETQALLTSLDTALQS